MLKRAHHQRIAQVLAALDSAHLGRAYAQALALVRDEDYLSDR